MVVIQGSTVFAAVGLGRSRVYKSLNLFSESPIRVTKPLLMDTAIDVTFGNVDLAGNLRSFTYSCEY